MPTAAHPRSRGENIVIRGHIARDTGSSPLTRGKLSGMVAEVLGDRLIPAHAGKTPRLLRRAQPRRAHPRSRGENAGSRVATVIAPGSSPLTRGKRREADAARAAHRLIPAHAGKTGCVRRGALGASAHPRSRGENACNREAPRSHAGSSPLTRGKRPGRSDAPYSPRLIPAHAGKTLCCY